MRDTRSELLAGLENNTYVFSYEARAVSGNPTVRGRLREELTSGRPVEHIHAEGRPTAEWQRFYATATVSKHERHAAWLVILAVSGTGTAEFRRPKLEYGTEPTAWLEAPGDIRATVRQVSQSLADTQQAQAAKNTEVESRLGNAESTVRQVSQTVADINGNLSSLHTVRVETVNGNRKVLAGLSLFADGQTGRSDVLFYADRFGIVDPQSQSVQMPFTVTTENGRAKVGLRGDMIADGTILGRHIRAGAELRSPLLEAGVMRGGQIDIGNGQFTVDNSGLMTANQGVFRGRIEAEDGYFKGTVYADRIEGDVLKMHRLEEVSTGHYRLVVPNQRAPVIVSLMPTLIEVPEGNARLIWKMDNQIIRTWTAAAKYRVYSPNPSNDHPIYRGAPVPVAMHVGGDGDLDIGSHTVEIFYERQNTSAAIGIYTHVGEITYGHERGGFYRASLPSAPILWIGRA